VGNGAESIYAFGTNLLPEPNVFGAAMRKHLDEYGDDHEQVLRLSAEIAHNLEALKMAVAFVRRQAMLDAQLELGNGAEVGRLAGVGRVRSHELLNRAIDERMHNVALTDVVPVLGDAPLYA
tara:strand:- start:36 stop:401 length:366 start_codon:yes stop_codon:yes gene_type:complete